MGDVAGWEFIRGMIDHDERPNYLGIADDMYLNYESSVQFDERSIGLDGFVGRLERCDFMDRRTVLTGYMESRREDYDWYWRPRVSNPDRVPRTPDSVEEYVSARGLEEDLERFVGSWSVAMGSRDRRGIQDMMVYGAVSGLFRRHACLSVYVFEELSRRGVFVPRSWMDSYEYEHGLVPSVSGLSEKAGSGPELADVDRRGD